MVKKIYISDNKITVDGIKYIIKETIATTMTHDDILTKFNTFVKQQTKDKKYYRSHTVSVPGSYGIFS